MASSADPPAPVAVVGGGAVGCAVARALSLKRIGAVLVEAEEGLARWASGTNSGILHTGFDSKPGELETEMIVRAAELRRDLLDKLAVPAIRCGAELRPRNAIEEDGVRALAANAAANGVEVALREDGVLEVPGETVTDPVAYTEALAADASNRGAEIRRGARLAGIEAAGEGLKLSLRDGEQISVPIAVNCAGLNADEVARMAGDHSLKIYPRKGEFFVFEPPAGRLERILLPVPDERTKGVLVFPNIAGDVVAGPTAHDQEDKSDLAVRPDALDEVMAKAAAIYPPLEGAKPVASRACLRPAGRGVNYVIGPSEVCPQLVNVAAIRSTGLSASLGIGEYVAAMVEEML